MSLMYDNRNYRKWRINMPFNNIEKFYFGDLGKSSYDIRAELVDNPEHYNQGGIECIDAMKAMLTDEEFIGFLRGNSFKYRWRYRYKDTPKQDLLKAKWYEDKLLELYKTLEGNKSDGSKSGTDC